MLGIETTCDETAASVVQDGKIILSNTIHSQIEIHRPFGGVFPELASKDHEQALFPVIEEALQTAGVALSDIDLVAVAEGPGLIGPLLIGVNAAKALAFGLQKPFIGVNHVLAHIYASGMRESLPEFPSLGIVISGGHTLLLYTEDLITYQKVGTTVDDAVGEAFDKVAKMLDLPYPGGPEIEALAKEGNCDPFRFKPGRVKENPYDFSFSGLKTNVFYAIYGQNGKKTGACPLSLQEKADIAASFQETALCDVVRKALAAKEAFGCKSLCIGGGVSANGRLREMLTNVNCPVYFPPKGLSLDNAAMIAGLGYHLYRRNGKGDPWDLEPKARIPLS